MQKGIFFLLSVIFVMMYSGSALAQDYDYHPILSDSFVEGDVLGDDGTSAFRRGEASNNQPLPNVGIWYNVSPARKWLIHARVDWISASIGDYNCTLWNTAVGVG